MKWNWSTPKKQLVEMIEVQRIEIINLQSKIKHYETQLEKLLTSYETLQRQLVEQRERLQQRERQLTEQMEQLREREQQLAQECEASKRLQAYLKEVIELYRSELARLGVPVRERESGADQCGN